MFADIPVHDSLGVRGVQRVRHLNGDRQGVGQRQRRAANQRVQRLALDVFHGQEADARGLPDFEHARHIGMAQCRGGLGFLNEAPHAVRIARYFRR